ncbi:O-antigen ligase family protein [Eubacterium coprostanoligenes]|uniref:O-antigen ligase family protein n=1 Tax=Eubacterium coprostanoligenes TaxID=290054 RepID=UPI002352FD40|nr:O-antigen ligase family protein [Eubacterium coprostanoligenes]MCI6353596.1 O-antigen ligase family protein [Eubacterium coprostanoligenes]MDD6665754.1 O-antigen ligase family protein [Eubacterium coprostanoligenes]
MTVTVMKEDKKIFTWLLTIIGVSFILPEYIAPLFVFFFYIPFLRHFKKTGRNAKIGNLGKAFMAYMCYMIMSGIWSGTHLFSSLIGLLWMGCFLFYIESANIINTKDKLKNAIFALNISSGVIGIIATLEFATYNLTKYVDGFNFTISNPLYYQLNDWVFSLFPFEIINSQYPSRAAATFDNPLILATFLIITTPFCAFSSVYFKHSKHRKLSRVCFAFSLLGILCTESRGAYIAIALSIVTLLISSRKIFKKLLPFMFVLAIGIPLTIALRYKNNSSGNEFLASNNNRLAIWRVCADLFTEHPIIGMGAGTENIHQEIIQRIGINRSHAHNLFLEIATEGGIIGVVLVIAIIVVFAKNLFKLFYLKNNAYRPYAVLYTSSIIGFITMSLYEHTLQSPKEMMVFFLFLGFAEATLRMAEGTIQLSADEVNMFEDFSAQDYITDEEEQQEKELITK